jgi:hypothetical protein
MIDCSQRSCIGEVVIFRVPSAEMSADSCFIVEDNIYSLISNVKARTKADYRLLLIALPPSPAIANTFVGISFLRII